MGSFDYTCSISGLPIVCGDPIRFFLLTKNPYQEEDVICDMNDIWTPRTFPLKAEYDDYGSVKDLQEGVQRNIWFDAFKEDLVIKDTGSNFYHDVEVNHSMGLDKWLYALSKGRVFVRDLDRDNKDIIPSIGVPTIERMSLFLIKNDIKKSVKYKDNGFLIDELEPGTIRFRANYYDSSEIIRCLKIIENKLSGRYATMIRTGTGCCADIAELIVSPKPLLNNTEYYNTKIGNYKSKKELNVSQAMIREDVWQKISNLEFNNWNGRVISKEKYVEYFKLAYDKVMDIIKGNDCKTNKLHLMLLSGEIAKDRKNEKTFQIEYKIRMITKDAVPFVLGLSTHFGIFCRSKHTKEESEEFIDVMAEFTMITDMLNMTRYYWRPSGIFPQYGEWGKHKQFHKVMVDICDQQVKKIDEDIEEFS